jgi:hypothetical protein
MKQEFSGQIFENITVSYLFKIRPLRVELFHLNGRTDRHTGLTKLIVTFLNFSNAPKELVWIPRSIWDFVKMASKEIWWQDAIWFRLFKDNNYWTALMNPIMSLRLPWNLGNFLTSWGNISFFRRTQQLVVNLLVSIHINFILIFSCISAS